MTHIRSKRLVLSGLSGFYLANALTTALASALVLAGCTVGPDYVRPTVAVPAQFKEAAQGWKPAQPADASDRGPWWQVFDDAELSGLLARVEQSNQTVAGFDAAYQQARALVSEARAGYFPTVGASAGATRAGGGNRARSSSIVNGTGTTVSSSGSSVTNDYSLSLDASWEPDFWGSVRRQAQSARAGVQAASADLANARLAAQATLAQDYFQMRALDSAQQLLDDTVNAFQRSLQLTQNRYASGVAGRADVLQAQTQLQSAQSAAVDNAIARAQFEHAIAVLVGVPASTFSIPPVPLTATPPPIPAQLPSALLERRPDVAAAERRAAAANEQIGIETAAFFPSLTLSASGGFESSAFSQWLSAPARVWSLGPQLAATLFDGGLRSARVAAARATYDQDVANYRQTVLAAFQDVEDNLVALRVLDAEIVVQQSAVGSAQQALAIVTNEYKAGTTTYIDVITSQTAAFSAQRTLADIAGRRMVAAAGLIKALGGGWDAQQMDLATSAAKTGT